MPKDKALQQAKIKYLNSADPLKSHPYFWAAYVHIGNNQAIIQKDIPRMMIILGIILVTSFTFFRFRKQIKKNHIKKGE